MSDCNSCNPVGTSIGENGVTVERCFVYYKDEACIRGTMRTTPNSVNPADPIVQYFVDGDEIDKPTGQILDCPTTLTSTSVCGGKINVIPATELDAGDTAIVNELGIINTRIDGTNTLLQALLEDALAPPAPATPFIYGKLGEDAFDEEIPTATSIAVMVTEGCVTANDVVIGECSSYTWLAPAGATIDVVTLNIKGCSAKSTYTVHGVSV